MSNKQIPTIYIHRAHFKCADPELYRKTFNNVLGAECVSNVDIIKKKDKNNNPFIRAFIHFNFWPHNNVANKMHNELMMDKQLEITYNHDTKWFWKFCRSKFLKRDDLNVSIHNNKKTNNNKTNNNKTNNNKTNNNEVIPNIPVLKRNIAYGYTYSDIDSDSDSDIDSNSLLSASFKHSV